MAITLPGVDRAYLGRVYKKKNIGPDPSTLNIETFKEARIESIRREISDKQGEKDSWGDEDIQYFMKNAKIPMPKKYVSPMAQFREEFKKKKAISKKNVL